MTVPLQRAPGHHNKIMRDDDVLTAGEVAKLFRVDAKTVSRWANEGRVRHFRTPGGHRRFRYGDIKPMLAEAAPTVNTPAAP